jgi:hypothetical protein
MRKAMIQPYVYWTLEAPFATIIGLYSGPDVPELDEDQINWFTRELRTAAADKALIVATHHFAYSASHQGRQFGVYMQKTLESAFQRSGRTADVVFAAHAMNYQRFTHTVGGRKGAQGALYHCWGRRLSQATPYPKGSQSARE